MDRFTSLYSIYLNKMFARMAKSALIGIPVGVVLFDYVGYIARVEGISMQPSLNPGAQNDYVFLSKIDIHKGE